MRTIDIIYKIPLFSCRFFSAKCLVLHRYELTILCVLVFLDLLHCELNVQLLLIIIKSHYNV